MYLFIYLFIYSFIYLFIYLIIYLFDLNNSKQADIFCVQKYNPKKHLCIALRKGLSISSEASVTRDRAITESRDWSRISEM